MILEYLLSIIVPGSLKIFEFSILSDQISKELAVKLYSSMFTLQMMDTVFNEMQTQGRTSFYMASHGEEAINIASAAALTNDDVICPQVSMRLSLTSLMCFKIKCNNLKGKI